MGSPDTETGRGPDEGPVHRVTIGYSLGVGRFEVTQGEWKALMGSNPSGFNNCGDRCPVEQVSWDDAQGYLGKLSEKTGKKYRLLTESEWEYVARAGTGSAYPWGSMASHEHANYGKDACCGGLASGRDRWENTAPVGQFPANGFGVYDMHGNVWEWVQDVWHDSYAGAPSDGSGWERGGDGTRRVLRGGSWYDYPTILRSAIRYRNAPDFRNVIVGFRVARTLDF